MLQPSKRSRFVVGARKRLNHHTHDRVRPGTPQVAPVNAADTVWVTLSGAALAMARYMCVRKASRSAWLAASISCSVHGLNAREAASYRGSGSRSAVATRVSKPKLQAKGQVFSAHTQQHVQGAVAPAGDALRFAVWHVPRGRLRRYDNRLAYPAPFLSPCYATTYAPATCWAATPFPPCATYLSACSPRWA